MITIDIISFICFNIDKELIKSTGEKMLFTAYCLSYGNWTVIPKQWRESFSDMKNCGFDAVALSYSESDRHAAPSKSKLIWLMSAD